jgi:two-component system response regulator EvgA
MVHLPVRGLPPHGREAVSRSRQGDLGEAEDAAGALVKAHTLAPQAVLLDVLLPDASGLEVAAELARGDDGPVVVLTSSRSERDLGVTLREAPARGFIPEASFTGAAFAELVA